MKRARVLCVIIIIAFICCLCACNDDVFPMERDMSVDLTSDIGLYFFGGDIDDYVRYSDDIAEEYFDREKPTMVYFHGWVTEEKQEGDIHTGMRTCQAAITAGAPDLDYVALFKQQGYNVCTMDYCRYAGNLIKLAEYIWAGFDGGHSIACRFAKEFAHCFDGYSQEVRFWGHSYGAQSSLATAYLLYKMQSCGLVSNDCLPKRISLADPYIGDMTLLFDDDILDMTIDNVGEKANGRTPTEIVADVMEYLNGKGVVIDAYCAMPMAYDQYFENQPQRRIAVMDKLHANSVWTVLEGCQQAFGTVGDIHVIAEDWMFHSYFADIKYADGEYYPTAALPTDEMAKLIGRAYKSSYVGFDVEQDVLIQTNYVYGEGYEN